MPEIGTERLYRGQPYRLVAVEPHRRQRDGEIIDLLVWESRCADCGEVFQTKLASYRPVFQPGRRCELHRKPGRRV